MSMRQVQKRISGQSTVMVMMLTMIVVMMIAFTTNLGTLVTQRITMQNTADLAAYSAAATQAGVLNKIRDHNQKIWKTIRDTRQRLQPTDTFPIFGHMDATCPGCYLPFTVACPIPLQNNIPKQIQNLAEMQIQIEVVRIEVLKNTIGVTAYQAARDSADKNYPGTTVVPMGNSLSRAPIKNDKMDVDYRGWGQIQGGPFCPFNGMPVGSIHVNKKAVPSWYYRDDSAGGELLFAVRASGTPTTDFLGSTQSDTYLGNYFGNRRQLVAYATAYPMAGKVGTVKGGKNFMTGEKTWNGPGPTFLTNSLQIGQGQVDKASILGPAQVIGGSYKDYKARYVGIFESEAQFVGGQGLTGSVPRGNDMAH